MTNSKLYSFDISFVDELTQTYYLADRSNAAVDVVDAKTATLIGQISVGPPFAGFVPTATCQAAGGANCSGPTGVVIAYPWLFVTDGGSRVVNIDLRTCQIDLKTCQIAPSGDVVTVTADPNRADELAYAPGPGLLLVINNADSPPFGTFISVNKTTGALTVGEKITFTAATNGAEQPVWNPYDGRFYLSIPSISGTTTARARPERSIGSIRTLPRSRWRPRSMSAAWPASLSAPIRICWSAAIQSTVWTAMCRMLRRTLPRTRGR